MGSTRPVRFVSVGMNLAGNGAQDRTARFNAGWGLTNRHADCARRRGYAMAIITVPNKTMEPPRIHEAVTRAVIAEHESRRRR